MKAEIVADRAEAMRRSFQRIDELIARHTRTAAVDRALTLSAAHRLLQSLSEQTQSRSELAECRDVMAALERMVEGDA